MSTFRCSFKCDSRTIQKSTDLSEEEMNDALHEWLTYGEYLEIEIDLKAKTCVVIAPDED